jgi:hypothetical protein
LERENHSETRLRGHVVDEALYGVAVACHLLTPPTLSPIELLTSITRWNNASVRWAQAFVLEHAAHWSEPPSRPPPSEDAPLLPPRPLEPPGEFGPESSLDSGPPQLNAQAAAAIVAALGKMSPCLNVHLDTAEPGVVASVGPSHGAF